MRAKDNGVRSEHPVAFLCAKVSPFLVRIGSMALSTISFPASSSAMKMTVRPRAVLERASYKMRVPYELKLGQSRLFHELPSGLKMEVIFQKGLKANPEEEANQSKIPPLVFVHGSFHAAWCWAEHWLPFFSQSGFDCYALSLLGQGESDTPAGAVAGSLQVTRSLAAKAFQTSLPLCKETFFSASMEDHSVLRYQQLMTESSRMPLFDLRKLNASLPVPSVPKSSIEVLVLGANDDFIVDAEGLNETGRFYDVPPLRVEGVAHDMMLDCSWEQGATAILSWLQGLKEES